MATPVGGATAETSAVNLPIPILSTFSCDELSLIFGSCLVDAVFVVDRDSGTLVAVNKRLLDLLGRDLGELEESETSFSRFVHPDDRSIFQTFMKEDLLGREETFDTRLEVAGESAPLAVEVAAKTIRWHSREYFLGFVRPCGDRLDREVELREQAELQKGRAMQALKSSLRVYELNEKIKSTLVLTTTLLNVENEEQLYRESVKILTNAEGLNFRHATFYVKQAANLRAVSSTDDISNKTISLTEDNAYSRAIRTGFHRGVDETSTTSHQVLVPLESREALLGIMEVCQYPREKAFFDEYRLITEWQRDMLTQIGDIIALLLDNLRLNRELKRQSIIDPLTGAYNRNFFMTRLESEIRRAARYGRPVSLVFIDVDHFKQVNDHYSHLQGDEVLRELGRLFLGSLRETDILCRYGGDEFVVILPESDGTMAHETAEKIRDAVRSHHFSNLDAPSQSIPMTVSLGVSTMQPEQSAEEFLHQADAALYRAKQGGRDRLAH